MKFLKMLNLMFLPFGYFAMYEDEPVNEPVNEPVEEPVEEIKPKETIQKALDKSLTQKDVAALRAENKALKAEIAIAGNKPDGTASPEFKDRLSRMEATVNSIGSQLNQDARFDAIMNLTKRFPDLVDKKTNLPLFNYELPVEEMIANAESMNVAVNQVKKGNIEEVERRYSTTTNLTRIPTREEIQEVEDKDTETANKGGLEGNRARMRIFQRRLQKAHGR